MLGSFGTSLKAFQNRGQKCTRCLNYGIHLLVCIKLDFNRGFISFGDRVHNNNANTEETHLAASTFTVKVP